MKKRGDKLNIGIYLFATFVFSLLLISCVSAIMMPGDDMADPIPVTVFVPADDMADPIPVTIFMPGDDMADPIPTTIYILVNENANRAPITIYIPRP